MGTALAFAVLTVSGCSQEPSDVASGPTTDVSGAAPGASTTVPSSSIVERLCSAEIEDELSRTTGLSGRLERRDEVVPASSGSTEPLGACDFTSASDGLVLSFEIYDDRTGRAIGEGISADLQAGCMPHSPPGAAQVGESMYFFDCGQPSIAFSEGRVVIRLAFLLAEAEEQLVQVAQVVAAGL